METVLFMGRYSTGAITTGQARRIELSYLLKENIIKKDHSFNGSISWTDGSSISLYSVYNDSEAFIDVSYTTTYNATNEKKDFKYRIELETVPSNLGKGEVVYFICPDSGKRCRILYKCYGSDMWKARETYQNRIYYENQIENKRFRGMKGLYLDRQISELFQKAKKSHYKGKPTHLMKRINKLQQIEAIAYKNYDSIHKLMLGIR